MNIATFCGCGDESSIGERLVAILPRHDRSAFQCIPRLFCIYPIMINSSVKYIPLKLEIYLLKIE